MTVEPRLSTLTAAREPDELARGFVVFCLETCKGFDGASSPTDRVIQRLGPHHGFVERLERFQKAAVGATGGPAAIAALGAELGRSFLNLIAPLGLRGRIPFLPLPPYVSAPIGSSTGIASFVGSGAAIPVVRFDLTTAYLGASQIGIIAVFTNEFLRSAGDRTVSLLERHLARLVVDAEDEELLSATAAIPGERPAGLTWNKTAVGSGSPNGFPEDLSVLIAETRGGAPVRPWLVLSLRGFAWIAASFPGLVVNGTIAGIPFVISRAAGNRVIMIDADGVGMFDGGLTVDRAESASLHMDSAPSSGSNQTSLYQSDSTAIRLIRRLDWAIGYDDAVQFIELDTLNGSPS